MKNLFSVTHLVAAFVCSLALSTFSQANMLTYDQGIKSIGSVNLSPVAKINDVNGKPTTTSLNLLGAGLRTKTVLFVAAKVYVAQLFANNSTAFVRDQNTALDSLVKNSSLVALKISMLRNVSASSLAVSFREAIQANGYPIDAELNQLLNIVETSADADQDKSLSMFMARDSKTQAISIYYEDVNGAQKSFVGSPELMTKVMSIWLGKSADQGLADLKTSMLKPVY